jgi:hypothetical protein
LDILDSLLLMNVIFTNLEEIAGELFLNEGIEVLK